MTELITTDLVALDATFGDNKDDVIRGLAARVAAAGRSADADGLAGDAFAREAKSATGMPGGLAIPHCRSEHVTESTLAFARLSPPVDFGSKDGPADLVFMIAAPASGDQEHMKLLTQLARALVRKDFTDTLRQAGTAEEVVAAVSEVVRPPGAPVEQPAAQPATQPSQAATPPATATATAEKPSLVAVTSCPTGIAHTFMAAEALEEAARKAGIDLHVEPQGSVGSSRLHPKTIGAAGAVIFATDVGVRDKERFAGLAEVKASVKDGIHHADDLIAKAVAAANDPRASRVAGAVDSAADGDDEGAGQSVWIKARTALLTGVSYMIPFVAAGGLLIALSFLLGGYTVDPSLATTHSLGNLPSADAAQDALFGSPLMLYLGAVFLLIGKAAFTLFIPALAAYIAYAIADRPGIAPGFVVGLLCGGEGAISGLNGIGAGFLGAIVGGFLAGVVALWIASLDVPRFVRGLMPVVIIPLFATLIAGGLMVLVLGRPLAWLTEELQSGLTAMSGGWAIGLGILLGLMMCFDLGGPVNKAAYVFATTGLSADPSPANLKIMAAVMLAGMVPPLALALASAVRPRLFTEPERENGRAAWLLGASFITEGAIPFAAADPLRVIPAMMAGGAVTGGLAMALGVELSAPHGGIFVLFAVDGVIGFLISLAAGTVVGAAVVVALKSLAHRRRTVPAAEPVAAGV